MQREAFAIPKVRFWVIPPTEAKIWLGLHLTLSRGRFTVRIRMGCGQVDSEFLLNHFKRARVTNEV